MSKDWHIWSIEHNAWWNPNSNGYTGDRTRAGIYSYEEASAIVRGANAHSSRPFEAMVPVEDPPKRESSFEQWWQRFTTNTSELSITPKVKGWFSVAWNAAIDASKGPDFVP